MAAKNVLYVFDRAAGSRQYFHQDNEGGKIFLCPLTVDQGCISSITKKLRSETKREVVLLNFPKLFNEKAFSIREKYIQFIAEFADKKINGKNLKEYFKLPLEDLSAWWFSLIAEKNTLKTDSYHKLCQFLTILDIQKKYSCSEIWIDINDKELARSLINQGKKYGFTPYNLRNYKKGSELVFLLFNFIFINTTIIFLGLLIRSVFRSVFAKIRMRGLNARNRVLENCRFLLVTYFPLVDKEQLKEKKFIDKYYQPLQRALENKKEKFAWLGIIVRLNDYDWNKSVALGKQINEWGYPLYFTPEWLRLRDFLIIIVQHLYISLKFLIRLPHISREFKLSSGENIWRLFKNDWYSSFCGHTLLDGLTFYHLFKRVFSQLKEDTVVTYMAEMHAWEKALNMAARERKGLKVIGIQHTTVPLLLLNHFNHKTELYNGDNLQTMPTPNYLACVGEIPSWLFIESGWDKNKVFVLGAIRFQHCKEYLKNKTLWNKRENKVVVALTISPEESKEVLTYVYHAFNDQNKYKVILKGHPCRPVSLLLDSLGIKLNEDIFEIVETPIPELTTTAKAMVVTGSSSALESVACQCPIIVPRLANFVDMNPLSGISNLPIYVDSPIELKEVVDDIMEREESPLSYEECKKFIQSYCDFPESEEEFLKRIEKLK